MQLELLEDKVIFFKRKKTKKMFQALRALFKWNFIILEDRTFIDARIAKKKNSHGTHFNANKKINQHTSLMLTEVRPPLETHSTDANFNIILTLKSITFLD